MKRRCWLIPHARHVPSRPLSWNRSPGTMATDAGTCGATRDQSSRATASLVISTVSELRNVAVETAAFQNEYSACSATERSGALVGGEHVVEDARVQRRREGMARDARVVRVAAREEARVQGSAVRRIGLDLLHRSYRVGVDVHEQPRGRVGHRIRRRHRRRRRRNFFSARATLTPTRPPAPIDLRALPIRHDLDRSSLVTACRIYPREPHRVALWTHRRDARPSRSSISRALRSPSMITATRVVAVARRAPTSATAFSVGRAPRTEAGFVGTFTTPGHSRTSPALAPYLPRRPSSPRLAFAILPDANARRSPRTPSRKRSSAPRPSPSFRCTV